MTFVVDALATFRLTRLATADTITEPLRLRVRSAAMNSTFEQSAAIRVEKLLSCAWCSSFWLALGVVSARRLFPRAWGPVATALAYSAVSGLVAENLD